MSAGSAVRRKGAARETEAVRRRVEIVVASILMLMVDEIMNKKKKKGGLPELQSEGGKEWRVGKLKLGHSPLRN